MKARAPHSKCEDDKLRMTLEAGSCGSFASIQFHNLLSSSQVICLPSNPIHLPCIPGWAPGPGTPRGKSIAGTWSSREVWASRPESCSREMLGGAAGAGGQSVGETAPRARGVSHLSPGLLVTMIM